MQNNGDEPDDEKEEAEEGRRGRGVISPCQKHGTARSQSVRQRGDFYRPSSGKGGERPFSLPPPNLCVKGISNMKLGGGEGRASLGGLGMVGQCNNAFSNHGLGRRVAVKSALTRKHCRS